MDVDGSGMVDQEEAVAWLADFDYFSQVCSVWRGLSAIR
jgi:hypothetical protein